MINALLKTFGLDLSNIIPYVLLAIAGWYILSLSDRHDKVALENKMQSEALNSVAQHYHERMEKLEKFMEERTPNQFSTYEF